MAKEEALKAAMRLSISEEARSVLQKLPPADIITIMEGLPVASDNNKNNNVNSRPMERELSKDEMLKAMEMVPTEAIRDILRAQNIIQ